MPNNYHKHSTVVLDGSAFLPVEVVGEVVAGQMGALWPNPRAPAGGAP
uniref:Uncharacterized protein n=1 Tax=Arundo donax TaxID=35708 RepID=A0A0A9D6E8_ARUDO